LRAGDGSPSPGGNIHAKSMPFKVVLQQNSRVPMPTHATPAPYRRRAS